jgi:hypothetical protein
MKKLYYYQCELRKEINNGYKTDVAWLPEKYAIIGKYLKINEEDGWKVIWIGAKQPANVVEEKERDYLRQRKASDI